MPVCNICPLGTVCVHDASVKVSATSNEPKDQAVLRGEPFRKYAVEAILLDLIAEVYAAHDRDDLYYTAAARESLMVSAIDRAEARLREVQGE